MSTLTDSAPSFSHRRHDRLTKRKLYQEVEVAEYWIVDTDAGVVERWRPGDDKPEVLAEQLEWHPDARVPPLVVDLRRLMEEAAAMDDEG